MNTLRFETLNDQNWSKYEAMQRSQGCAGCHCMYWHFEGDNRTWQLRTPDENARDQRARVIEGKTVILLGLFEETVVASVQLARRDSVLKLLTRAPYRGLEPDPNVWAILCFLVRPEWRRQGSATQLLQGTIEYVRSMQRGVALESYPRTRPLEEEQDLTDEELWMGPSELYRRSGFHITREHATYPVFRLELKQ